MKLMSELVGIKIYTVIFQPSLYEINKEPHMGYLFW